MTTHTVTVPGLQVRNLNRILFYSVGTIIFSVLTAVAAQFTVSIPFSPVPLSLQVIPAFLAGAVLGPWAGFMSMVLYILAGISGLPVFSFGRLGIVHVMGPTGGYLVGYSLGAWVVGTIIRFRSSFRWSVVSISVGMIVLFFCGLLQLSFFTGFNWEKTLSLGFYPFIIQDVTKIWVIASIYQGILRYKNKKN